MKETKEILVSLSGMPFSAVVLGVGDGDFKDMEVLDADATVLTDEKGNEAIRDIVQLVQYNQFKDLGMRELAIEVLGEVPDQFVDYMIMMENDSKKIYNPYPNKKKQDKFDEWVLKGTLTAGVEDSLEQQKPIEKDDAKKIKKGTSERMDEPQLRKIGTIDMQGNQVPEQRNVHDQINKHNQQLRKQLK